MFSEELKAFRRLGIRHVLFQALNFASVIASGLMIWKGLGLVTNSESPIVVVLSGSMEPAFYRGDLLFLTNPSSERYHNGDITVYKIPGADIPIVHRVLETHDAKSRGQYSPLSQRLLTKGDNNERKHIVGKVRGSFYLAIWFLIFAQNDFPQLKYALLGGLGLLALIQRE
ncbi:signal peptidase complex catalytic subunit SEC11 [Mycena amicta]|nr:signal peptidase complex catalytic subunit SEC11 [Mycena amicta]